MNYSGAEEPREIVYPRAGRFWARSGRSWPWKAVLIPPSWLFQGVSSALKAVRTIDVGPAPRNTRVFSIGNLEVGGNGKTPLALLFLERLAAAGRRAAYVSRAFRSVAGRLNVVTVVLPATWDDSAPIWPGVRYVSRRSPALAREIGDEGAMIAARLPGVSLVFSRAKQRAVAVASDCLGCSDIVLDDAFQSWGVPRDVDVVLLDGRRPFGDGWLLPAGTLREPPYALERADILGFNGVDGVDDLESTAESVFRRLGFNKPFFGIRRDVEILDNRSVLLESCSGPSAALSAIAHPETFEKTLVSKGVSLKAVFRYADHHRFTRRDVEWLLHEVQTRGIERVITTEKDWAKLRDLVGSAAPFAVARLKLTLLGEDPLAIKKAAD